jgi:hypothetical protein
MTQISNNSTPQTIDARGPRFTAGITLFVLSIALLTHSPFVIGFQLLVFAIAAFIDLKKSPYGIIYRKLIQPRLSGPVPLEDQRPPRFAQFVGFIFALVAFVAILSGAKLLFTIATSFALIAAFLNAIFGFCLGCQMYLILVRIFKRA